jgi:hypothetical protein
MDRGRIDALFAFLGALPDSAALRLAQAVEQDRLAGGSNLPHALILEGLQPALERVPDRILAPLPVLIAGLYRGGPHIPDLSSAPDADLAAQAKQLAELVGGSTPVEFVSASGDIGRETKSALQSYCANIARELRAGTPHAESYAALAGNLRAELFGV